MKKKKFHLKIHRHAQLVRAVWIAAVIVGILIVSILHAASSPVRVTKLIVDHNIIVPAEGILVSGSHHD